MKEDSEKIGWWRARNLRSARKRDVLQLGLILFFAVMCIWIGNVGALHLSPSRAIQVSAILEELQAPTRLPNAPLVQENGSVSMLWELIREKRMVVSFYAPWCGPCQKELPELVTHCEGKDNLLVIVSSDENRAAVRQQLDNLGLKDLVFHVDMTGRIMKEGKVKSIPTTFLVARKGWIKERVVGYSPFRLRLLLSKTEFKDEI